MTWFNLLLASLSSPPFLAAPAAALGVWLRVMRHACEQECGGRIQGAMSWTDRQAFAACNCSRGELKLAIDAKLLGVDGDDILVLAYPTNRQADLQALRADGAAGGRARSHAKAEAARLNGRLGGRPRTREPEKPTETQPKPTETQPKPTETQRQEPKRIEIPQPTAAENPREEEEEMKGSVCGATTTTHEQDGDWVARVRRQWPGVNLDRELRRARSYVQRARGADAPLQRRWFETEWLPRCADPAAPDRVSAERAPKCETGPEPEGWREQLSESHYGPGGMFEVREWSELPRDVREHVRKRLAGVVRP